MGLIADFNREEDMDSELEGRLIEIQRNKKDEKHRKLVRVLWDTVKRSNTINGISEERIKIVQNWY